MNDKQAKITAWLLILIAVLTFIAAQWGKVTPSADGYTSSTASGPPSPQGEG